MTALVSVGSFAKKETAVGMSKMILVSGLYSLEASTKRKRKKYPHRWNRVLKKIILL